MIYKEDKISWQSWIYFHSCKIVIVFENQYDSLYMYFLYKFIYLFLAVLGLCCCTRAFSSCGERGATLRCSARASHCGGLSHCRARALGVRASAVVARGLSSRGLRAPEHRLSSRGTRAQLLRGMWDTPGSRIEPLSPALAGGLSTTAPPGKPWFIILI